MPDEMDMGVNRPRSYPNAGNSRGPRIGTAGGGGGNTGGTRHKSGSPSSCSMALPVAVALLPYALARLALDGWRARRGRYAS